MSSLQYPNRLKYADVTLLFKKNDKSDKSNYRSISTFPNLSKAYKRIMQICPKYPCGFRKEFSAQDCLIAMIEKWHGSLDSGGQAAAALTDLLEAFDCIDHGLLIAKLNAYRCDSLSLDFIYSYLSE